MSPLAVIFVLVLVSVAVTVATALPLLGTLLQRASDRGSALSSSRTHPRRSRGPTQ